LFDRRDHLACKCRNLGPDDNIERGAGLHDAAGVGAGRALFAGSPKPSRTKVARSKSMLMKGSATAPRSAGRPPIWFRRPQLSSRRRRSGRPAHRRRCRVTPRARIACS
jgi:hypothetical protein